jgi:hypothetical protein
MCFRMVRTKQGARTDLSPIRGSDQSFHNESDPDWDPLADISSRIPATPVRQMYQCPGYQTDMREIIYPHQWHR